ncbi:hypothetical protein JOB18_032233 [Solea senegalensis]|uniref:Uncharacterized protein n=1 Tax=Solea senegalensis TaxID=28829 RepID=A0AAV6QMZ6_SOLSE|nr:hypothetical protein JOB18_032233 [Solea senegalensis]
MFVFSYGKSTCSSLVDQHLEVEGGAVHPDFEAAGTHLSVIEQGVLRCSLFMNVRWRFTYSVIVSRTDEAFSSPKMRRNMLYGLSLGCVELFMMTSKTMEITSAPSLTAFGTDLNTAREDPSALIEAWHTVEQLTGVGLKVIVGVNARIFQQGLVDAHIR